MDFCQWPKVDLGTAKGLIKNMEMYFRKQRFGYSAVNFSLNLIYISDNSGKKSLTFVVSKLWIHSYLNIVTARAHNSYKRLIQLNKFNDSIVTVTASSHSKKHQDCFL